MVRARPSMAPHMLIAQALPHWATLAGHLPLRCILKLTNLNQIYFKKLSQWIQELGRRTLNRAQDLSPEQQRLREQLETRARG